MVAFGQIINLALLAGGVYIAITYGPDIMKWAKEGIDKIKTQAENGPSPSTGAPTENTPQYDPSSDGTGDQGVDLITPSGSPPSGHVAGSHPQMQTPTYTAPAKKSQDLNLSGGHPQAKHAPKRGQSIPSVTSPPPPSPAVLPSGRTANPLVPQTVPPAKPTKKSDRNKSIPPPPSLTTPPTRTRHRDPSVKRRPPAPLDLPADDSLVSPGRWPDTGHPFESLYPAATFKPGTLKPPASMCHCSGNRCCFTGVKCNGGSGQECAVTNARNRNKACANLRKRFLDKNQCGSPVQRRSVPAPLHSRFNGAPVVPGQLSSRFNGPPVTPAPASLGFELNPVAEPFNPQAAGTRTNAGFAYGDKGQLISLESLTVTIA